jgi:hypothetical protein
MSDPWTPERTEFAREHWLQGFAAAEIAKLLGDVTRNAVIGRLHRIGCHREEGVSPRAPRTPKSPSVRRAAMLNRLKGARITAKYESRRMETPLPIPSLDVAFLDREQGQCRAITDPTRYRQKCCGHPVAGELDVYCEGHKALYTKVQVKAAAR